MIKPNPLVKGDKVAIIAPSSAASESSIVEAEKRVRALGFEPVMFPTCFTTFGHLAATDEQRAKDINDAFKDDNIKGIICTRGGYGTPRIVNMLDYDMIKQNPKVFIGYSDITGLHVAFNTICRMTTYHGPMATSGYVKMDGDNIVETDKYSYDSMMKNIITNEAVGLFENPDNEKMQKVVGGKAKGEIIGGNLSLLVSTLGSPYAIDTKDKIIFIEEVGESVYKIDRMLTSLALAGKFDDCAGIILGTFSDCIREEKAYKDGLDLPLEEVIENTLTKFNKPIISNFRAGHNFPQPTIPFGTVVKMDADKLEVIFTESGNK